MALPNEVAKPIDFQKYQANKERDNERQRVVAEKNNLVPTAYSYDIKKFITHCTENHRDEDMEAMFDYLYVSIVNEGVKKSTWEKRLQAIKKYLQVTYGINFKTNEKFYEEVKALRMLYQETELAQKTRMIGRSPIEYNELLEEIHKQPLRVRTIAYINYLTGNRPNEMVSLKIEHFDLENRCVHIYLKKQKILFTKRLTLEAVKLVKAYIKEYELKPTDYFVGQVLKHGKYVSREITENAYWKFLQKNLGLTAYNLRKSLVKRLHDNGADVPTIAKQTGHSSRETIEKHYLRVSDTTIDKFLD